MFLQRIEGPLSDVCLIHYTHCLEDNGWLWLWPEAFVPEINDAFDSNISMNRKCLVMCSLGVSTNILGPENNTGHASLSHKSVLHAQELTGALAEPHKLSHI